MCGRSLRGSVLPWTRGSVRDDERRMFDVDEELVTWNGVARNLSTSPCSRGPGVVCERVALFIERESCFIENVQLGGTTGTIKPEARTEFSLL